MSRKNNIKLSAAAVGAIAVGSFALAALAVGAVAIGRLAIGQMAVRKGKLASLEIGELTVERLKVVEENLQLPNCQQLTYASQPRDCFPTPPTAASRRSCAHKR